MIEEAIIDSLESLADTFEDSELAYLSLTSKVEGPVRDKLAFSLFKVLPDNYIVSREWWRCDLVVLENNVPLALIELKAMYTFDALKKGNVNEYKNAIEKDIEKSRDLAKARGSIETEIYSIMLATHPRKEIPGHLDRIAKYHTGVNSALGKYPHERALDLAAAEIIEKDIMTKQIISKKTYDGGKAFGIPVDVSYRLTKA